MAMRLQKIIALSGVASRREAERLIAAGEVRVNGKVITQQGCLFDPAADRVQVQGRLLPPPDEKVYLLLYKPRGCVSTTSDEKGRPTVMDLIKKVRVRVFPVGRLDFNTEGALLFTNDGALAEKLLAPESKVPRTYLVKVRGIPTEKTLNRIRRGVRLEGPTLPMKAKVHRTTGNNSVLELELIEGKKHHIRRVCEKVGHRVVKIHRTQFANLDVTGVPPGAYRFLSRQEVRSLQRLVTRGKPS